MITSLLVEVTGESYESGSCEDFVSRPHKAVFFIVERKEVMQEWREQNILKALPGFSREKLPERSKAEKSRGEEDEEEQNRERQMRSEVT